MSCSTGRLIVPLSAGVTTVNIHDGKMYCGIVESITGLVENILCDPAYDDRFTVSFYQQEKDEIDYPNKAISTYTPRKNQTCRVL